MAADHLHEARAALRRALTLKRYPQDWLMRCIATREAYHALRHARNLMRGEQAWTANELSDALVLAVACDQWPKQAALRHVAERLGTLEAA